MGTQVSKHKSVRTEQKTLHNLRRTNGCGFPGHDYTPSDRKNWMDELDPHQLYINKIVWPGTHDSATNKIGIPLISRPLAQCQSLSIYDQLCMGTRALDIRVQRDRKICHGVLKTYGVEVVLADIKRFLSETVGEMILLEVRTEYGHEDPPGFEEYLVGELGELLIPEDESVFRKRVAEVLGIGRVICVWKPRGGDSKESNKRLWSRRYLVDDWIDTDLPSTKFESNLKCLGEQASVDKRRYFYRVENTVTPQAENVPVVCVWKVTKRIHGYARLFIAQCVEKGVVDRLQVFSTDFINEDFVDACVGVTYARMQEGDV